MVSWARVMPSMSFSSSTSFAPASIMTTPSSVPTTVMLSGLDASWVTVGLMMNVPSTMPTFTAPIGVVNGMLEK